MVHKAGHIMNVVGVGVGVAFMVTLYINVNITICRGRGSQRTAATPMIIIFNWFELVFNWFELVELVVVVVVLVVRIWVGVYNHHFVGGLGHFVYVTRGHGGHQKRG
jgi:hypothetical protein